MPAVWMECPLCGFEGTMSKFEVTAVHATTQQRCDHPSTLNCEHHSHDMLFVCKDECRGLRLSWRQRRKIQRDLQNWSR